MEPTSHASMNLHNKTVNVNVSSPSKVPSMISKDLPYFKSHGNLEWYHARITDKNCWYDEIKELFNRLKNVINPKLDLLIDIGKVLEERTLEIDTHKDLSTRVSDMKQKVRRQKEQIETKWATLIEQEKKECDMLNAEKLNLETQMKSEQQVGGSNSALHKIVAESKDKGNKPPPGRMGNYTIMAKRLQGEIKQLETNVNDMKNRLQLEIEKKNAIETKVKEMRTSLTLHRRQDPFSAPTTPTQ